MISVTCSRPFSELGDQQLLEQTRRRAANQRCIEVHILDHLDEIDRRGLALRRGFSSLFDYAVRELRYTDAAAQRRIQAMRLCRRHGWVRASLQSGELSMTSAAQLETTFAGAERAERAERQSRTGRRNVGRTRQLGLPPAPGEPGEQRERGPRSAMGLAPRSERCSGDAETMNTPVVPVASRAGAQDRGAGHAGALLSRPEVNVNAAPPLPAPSGDRAPAPVAGDVAGPAAPASDEGPAPQPLPPTDLRAQASVPAPVPAPVLPVAAPSESLRAASRGPQSPRDDPFAELSPGPSSAALLHPQRQRELIEQAAGMSTRQVAGLLAAAAPEVLPPRDTLRAVAPDRYTLKVSIDQECEQGLRLLKDLMSHVDPRMSWGDLVARVVREAVTRHDPRGGASGRRRRQSAGNAGAAPLRAPKKRRAAGAAAGPAQGVNESSRRAPNRTRAAGALAAPAPRGGGDTPAPPGGAAAATERQSPIAMLANAASPRLSAPACMSDNARAGGVPSGAPAAAAPTATSAPQFAAGASVDGSHPGAGAPISPVITSAPQPAVGVSPDGGRSGASAGAAAHTTCEPVHSRHQSPPRRHIPAAVQRHVWQRDGGRCCYRDPLSGRRCTSSHLLQIDHQLPVAEGGGPEPSNLVLRCFAHHRMRHGYGPAAPEEPPM